MHTTVEIYFSRILLHRVKLQVSFSSPEIGEFDTSIEFEICGRETWGVRNPHTVKLMGLCTYPKICQDPSFIFSKTLKSKPSLTQTQKYIKAERTLDFGSLFTNTQELLDESQNSEVKATFAKPRNDVDKMFSGQLILFVFQNREVWSRICS